MGRFQSCRKVRRLCSCRWPRTIAVPPPRPSQMPVSGAVAQFAKMMGSLPKGRLEANAPHQVVAEETSPMAPDPIAKHHSSGLPLLWRTPKKWTISRQKVWRSRDRKLVKALLLLQYNTIPWLLRSLLCLLLLFSCAQPCEGESYLPKRELRERGLRVTGASLCLRAALVVPGLLHLVILLHCAASCKHLLSYTL